MSLKGWTVVLSDQVPADGTPGGGAPAVEPVTDKVVASVPAATEEPVASSNVDWEDEAQSDLGSGDESKVVAPEPKVVTPVEPQVETPTPTPTPAVVQPVVAKPVEPTPTQPVQPTVVTPPAPTQEEVQRQAVEGRNRFIKQLEGMYAISEADAPSLVAEPEKVLPVLFAKAHAAVMDQVVQYIQASLPHMMKSVQAQESSVGSTLKQFYDAWPELNDPKYTETVARQLVAYRQANPTAKAEDVIHEGGVSAIVALRLPIPERLVKVHNAGSPSATPQQPFSPVSAGSAPSAPPQAGPTNAFAILAQEDLADGS